jgi:hypothetical protein
MDRTRFGRLGLVVGVLVASLVASSCLWLPTPFYRMNTPWDAGAYDVPTQRETFRIGPYNLNGMGEPGFEVLGWRNMPKPAGHVAIKRMDYSVVDASGNEVGMDRAHLHHIVMMDESRRDPLCPSVGARFSGSGGERTPMILRGQYAYLSRPSDQWTSTFHLHTTTSTPVMGAYIQYTVDYVPVTDPAAFRHVTPYFLDVTGCWENSQSVYDVPGGGGPGSIHDQSVTYTAQSDGIGVFAGGHIHAGARNIKLVRDATGEDYCTATASYAPGGHPNHPNMGQLQKISYCHLHVEVNQGETFTLTARHDNEYPVLKAMGIMLLYVWHPGG